MELITTIFQSGEIPQALNVAILVLLPKPNSNEYCGIGLLKTVWKLVSPIIDERLKVKIPFNDAVYGFRQNCGMGTAIL